MIPAPFARRARAPPRAPPINFAQIGRRVEVGQQFVDAAERLEVAGIQFAHPEDAAEVGKFQAAGIHRLAHGKSSVAPINRQQRFRAVRRPNPGGIGVRRQIDQPAEDGGIQKGHVARHHDDAVSGGDVEGRVHAAHGAGARHDVGMDRQSQVGKARRIVRHYEDVCSDPLQDLDLPYDD
jgi:hypothetical protein